MAVDTGRRAYPKIPAKNWWELRRRFQKSMPGHVTSGYLQSVLGVQEKSATNLLPQLEAVGLTDESGKPTPLANEWRTDEGYKNACQKIVESVYPQELRDAVHPSEPDRQAAMSWFMREQQVGEGAASQMASFYVLVCEANPEAMAQASSGSQPAKPVRTAERAKRSRAKSTSSNQERAVDQTQAANAIRQENASPALHIDVQIHIPSDATGEQIDAIFASMAKHLYGKR